jgi:hypothetical protein
MYGSRQARSLHNLLSVTLAVYPRQLQVVHSQRRYRCRAAAQISRSTFRTIRRDIHAGNQYIAGGREHPSPVALSTYLGERARTDGHAAIPGKIGRGFGERYPLTPGLVIFYKLLLPHLA